MEEYIIRYEGLLLSVSTYISELDCYLCYCEIIREYKMVKPTIVEDNVIYIKVYIKIYSFFCTILYFLYFSVLLYYFVFSVFFVFTCIIGWKTSPTRVNCRKYHSK